MWIVGVLVSFRVVLNSKNSTNYIGILLQLSMPLDDNGLLADAAILVFGLGCGLQIESSQGLSSIWDPL